MEFNQRCSNQVIRSAQTIVVLLLLVISGCSSLPTQSSSSSPSRTALLNLALCPTHVSNPPISKNHKRTALACIRGVMLHVAPAPKACLSSGFGIRGGKRHAGIDYQSKPAGPVVAAGNGTIIKLGFRKKDYGHWIIIDHGSELYTSYAHLAKVEKNLTIGARIKRGQRLGIMGKTGKAAKAVHLHYELRTGNYRNPKKWWGLKAVDPFSLPQRCS